MQTHPYDTKVKIEKRVLSFFGVEKEQMSNEDAQIIKKFVDRLYLLYPAIASSFIKIVLKYFLDQKSAYKAISETFGLYEVPEQRFKMSKNLAKHFVNCDLNLYDKFILENQDFISDYKYLYMKYKLVGK